MSNIFFYPQAHNEQLIIDHVWSINKIANRTKPGGKIFFCRMSINKRSQAAQKMLNYSNIESESEKSNE